MRPTKYIRQLAGESVVYGISGAVGRLVAVVLIPLYTRVFTRSELGVVALIDVMVNLAAVGAVLGLDNASARWYYDSDDAADRHVTIASWFWCQFTLSVVLAVAIFALASPLSIWIGGSTDYAGLVRLAALGVPLLAPLRVLGNWLRFQRRAWTSAATTTAQVLGRVGLILLLVLVFHQGLTGIYLARLIVLAALGLLATVMLRCWIAVGNVSLVRLKTMLRFGLPLLPAALGIWVMTSADRFILLMFRDSAEVGLYDLAVKLSLGAALAIVAFQQAWGPFAYSILNEKGSERVYARVLEVYSLAGCALATAVALFAPLLMRIMTTEDYYPAASSVPALAFVYFFVGAAQIAGLGSGIAKRSAPITWSVALGATVGVGLHFLLIPRWGRDGAAVATLAGNAANAVFLFVASQSLHRLPYRWRTTLACLALSWLLIATASRLVPEVTPGGLATRAAMLLAFFPLGSILGIVRRSYAAEFFRRN